MAVRERLLTLRLTLIGVGLAACWCGPVSADEFVFKDAKGEEHTTEGALYASGQGIHLVQHDDGRLDMLPQAAVVSRTPGPDPVPIGAEEMNDRLAERFGGEGGELYRGVVFDPYVVGLVLQAPLDRRGKVRADEVLKKAGRFLKSLDRSFSRFARLMGLPIEDPEFPLVMLIFETDEQFEAYATLATGGRGLSVENITGFYSSVTNWLAVRLDECDDYALPLHEGVHQQVYNRGWIRRFAPVPTWFDEGIATGFENTGENVSTSPKQLNARYAVLALARRDVSFTDVLVTDAAFRGDVLAGGAYMKAWALHWLLVTKKPKQYTEFVKLLGSREPLSDPDDANRLRVFNDVFGLAPAKLTEDFVKELDAAARRQKIRPPTGPTPGQAVHQDQMGQATLRVVSDARGRVLAKGTLKNVSPLRPLMFRVRLIPQGAAPIEWVVPELDSNKSRPLPVKASVASGQTFRIEIKSAIPPKDAVSGRR